MIVSVIAVALAALSFGLVAYPLLRGRRELTQPEVTMPGDYELAMEDLVAQRDATYATIKELDFDQEMGNLPEADYQELRERYRRKAATILHDLDELQAVPAQTTLQAAPTEEEASVDEDEIEREIRRRRRARRRARAARACQSCGTPLGPEDRFCGSCGAPVAGCPSCGAPYLSDDHFCARCGGALAGVAR